MVSITQKNPHGASQQSRQLRGPGVKISLTTETWTRREQQNPKHVSVFHSRSHVLTNTIFTVYSTMFALCNTVGLKVELKKQFDILRNTVYLLSCQIKISINGDYESTASREKLRKHNQPISTVSSPPLFILSGFIVYVPDNFLARHLPLRRAQPAV